MILTRWRYCLQLVLLSHLGGSFHTLYTGKYRISSILLSSSVPSSPTSSHSQVFTQAQILNDKCKVDDFEGIRGLRATVDIAPGEVFLSIPFKLCFVDIDSSHNNENSNWPARLALQLMRERRLGASSQWSEYIDVLAGESHLNKALPVHWQDPALLELVEQVSSGLSIEIENAREMRSQMWHELIESHQEKQYNREEFDWALDMVQSRNCRVILPGQTQPGDDEDQESSDESNGSNNNVAHVLAPFFDLMNHSPHVNTRFELKPSIAVASEWLLTVRYEAHGLGRGEQVFLNYGTVADASTLTAHEYLLYSYGFVPALTESDGKIADDPGAAVELYLPATDTARILMSAATASVTDSYVLVASKLLGVRLRDSFLVFPDGISDSGIFALRLLIQARSLSTASSSDLSSILASVQSNVNDSLAIQLLKDIIRLEEERLKEVLVDINIYKNTYEANPFAANSLSTLVQNKLLVLHVCRQWAHRYAQTFIQEK